MPNRTTTLLALAALLSAATLAAAAKPRVVITADPELDDNNTITRAILYSTDLQIEGLIYVSSVWHWKGDGKGGTQYIPGHRYSPACPCTSWRWPTEAPYTAFIDTIVDAYAKSYPNLRVHDPNYPLPATLKSKIKWGNVDFEGDYSKDTDGSNLIKSLLLDNQPGPLYVTAQGGQSTIARALKSIHDQYSKTPQWDTIRDKVSHKLVIVPFGDQDDTYARYIKPNWPEVTEWQLNMVDYGYGIRNGLAPEDAVYIGPAWLQENVRSRGPLGALYRVWGDGKIMDPTDTYGLRDTQPKGSFISEGDTPTFLNLLNNGLRAWENDGLEGGWGGIARSASAPAGGSVQLGGRTGAVVVTPAGPDDPGIGIGIAPAGSDANKPPAGAEQAGARGAFGRSGRGGAAGRSGRGGFGGGRGPRIAPRTAAIDARFFAAAQNEFAARLKWSVTPKYSDANHAPKVSVKGSLDVAAKPGATVRLQGAVSDPDHNKVNVVWWQYNDAGTYPGDIAFSDPAALTTTFKVPDNAQPGQTIHVILEATDNGTPPITRYQRVIVRIQ